MDVTPAFSIRKKVLLFDTDHRRREIRAANLRTRGVDVVCARNVQEMRDFWQPDIFQLLLLDSTNSPEIVQFSQEVRLDCPGQRLAFFVGKPAYLAHDPAADEPPPELATVISLEDAFKSLAHKNGFVEASLRMKMLRSQRRGATVDAPRDPWAKMKEFPDADQRSESNVV